MAAAVVLLLAPGLAPGIAPRIANAQSDALLNNYNQYATLFAQGKYEEVLPFLQKTYELHKQEFGAGYPTAAAMLSNMAELRIELGRLTKAEPLHLRTIAVKKEKFGPNHMSVAVSLNDLIQLYYL